MFDYSADILTCPICGGEISSKVSDLPCPRCWWTISGIEDEDENEYNPTNHCTMRQAKERYKQGLDIYGDPLPKEKSNN